MNRQGYIKISRSINQHWLWQDAERLKWWLDLLLLANWEDKKQLVGKQLIQVKRGQMVASVGFLMKRWKRSRSMVEPFLEMLIKEGMITKTMEHNIAVIEIVKYDEYQDTPSTYLKAENETQNESYLIGSKSSDYKESESHLESHPESYLEATNKLNKINKYISTTNARTREKELLLGDMSWSELIRMRYRLTPEQYRSELDNFFTDCECNGINVHKDVQDLKSHFNSWINRKQQLTKVQDNGTKETRNIKRRPVAATAGVKSDYDAAF